MDEFAKWNLIALQAEIMAAIAHIAEKHQVQFSWVGGQFRENLASLKMQVKRVDATGTTITDTESSNTMVEDFRRMASYFGFQPTDIGRQFTTIQGTYVIVGAKPRNHKFPIVAKCQRNGKSYKFTAEEVKRCLLPVVVESE